MEKMGGSSSKEGEKIERAQKTGILSLRDMGLSTDSLPSKIFSMPGLRVLDLANNKLTKLPPALGNLSALTSLTLDGNRLKALPDVLCTLVKLETLSVAHNKLEVLPEGLGKLTKLKKLLASHNALRELPNSLGGCAALVQLEAASNALASLPLGLGTLGSLLSADFSNNRLGALPPSGLGGLKRLKELDLRGNAPLVVHGAVPPELLLSTPLQHLQLDPEMLGASAGTLDLPFHGGHFFRRMTPIHTLDRARYFARSRTNFMPRRSVTVVSARRALVRRAGRAAHGGGGGWRGGEGSVPRETEGEDR